MLEKLLDRGCKYLTAGGLLLAVIETAVALLAGGLVGAAFSNPAMVKWAVLCSLAYLALFAMKIYTQKLFPAALFGELQAQEKLRLCSIQLERRDQVFRYIEKSVAQLNMETCAISSAASDVCNRSVKEGLATLLDPIISHPHYVLACHSNRFTVAARIGHYDPDPRSETNWTEFFEIFRDDLGIGAEITRLAGNGSDGFTDLNATGVRLLLRNAMHEAFNHNRYHISAFSHENQAYTAVCSPIPLICEAPDAGGVILIVTDTAIECPCDMPDVLRIYGRLAANWLAKYGECLNQRSQPASQDEESEEECCPPFDFRSFDSGKTSVSAASTTSQMSTTSTTPNPHI